MGLIKCNTCGTELNSLKGVCTQCGSALAEEKKAHLGKLALEGLNVAKKAMNRIKTETSESILRENEIKNKKITSLTDELHEVGFVLQQAMALISALIVLCISLIILHFDLLNLNLGFDVSFALQFGVFFITYLISILIFVIIFNILKYYYRDKLPFYIKEFSAQLSGMFIVGLYVFIQFGLIFIGLLYFLYPLLPLFLINYLGKELKEKNVFKPMTINIIIRVLYTLNIIWIIWEVVKYFN